MTVLITNDTPKTCCCGCSLYTGILVMTVLAGVEVISDLISGWYKLAFCSAVFCASGVLAIKNKEDKTYREANFWVWLVIYTLAAIGTFFELIYHKDQL